MERTTHHRRRNDQRGMSLPELLVVLSVIGMAVAVSIPLVSGAILASQLRTGADQFRISLQAARMIAVSRQAPVPVRIFVHPENRYEYEDIEGRTRVSRIPPGICIESASPDTITFQPNGSIGGSAATVFTTVQHVGAGTVCALAGGVDSLRVDTNLLGTSTVTRGGGGG